MSSDNGSDITRRRSIINAPKKWKRIRLISSSDESVHTLKAYSEPLQMEESNMKSRKRTRNQRNYSQNIRTMKRNSGEEYEKKSLSIEDSSILDAASNGANNAIPIVLGITANIVAFVAFVAFLNAIVNWFGLLVGLDSIDFEWIFSKLFIPLVWAMGIPYKDCDIVAKIVATKTLINEFVAYERLGEYIKNGQLDARSIGIATFAICGFANPSALGILIGTLSAMAPNRRYIITSVAIRAFVVGSVVCFVSASFAGLLIQEEEERRVYAKYLDSAQRKT